MRRTNKIVSLMLALGMLLSMALPTVTSAADLSFSDVPSDYTYYSAITDLTAEGIINGFEDGTFKPEDPVTRAQFTKLICLAENSGNIKYSEADRAKFPDVVSTGTDAHWAIDFITTAKNSGIINGYDDGTFKPENSVLYEQAVKMAVCALGYTEDRAERAGGTAGAYPSGYLNLAVKAKLLDKISGAKMGEPLTRGRVAQLIYNMRNAEMVDPITGETSGSMRDQTSSTRSSAEGRIVAVYGTSLYYDEESECNKKQIELELSSGKREFYGIENLKINDLNDYLGRSVTVYYDIESGADYYEAYNIAFQNKKNYELTINMDDIEEFNGSKLEYWTEDKDDTENISIDSDIAIIHNGQSVNEDFGDIIDEFASQSGYITLVCSMNNDIADVAFIRTYETIFVNSPKDSKNYKVYDYYDSSKSFILDETDKSKKITFTKNGSPSDFSGIPTTCVLSVSESSDGKLIDVQISTKTQAGTVTDIISDDRIKIDKTPNTYYRFTESCNRSEQINAGMYVQFYLDAFGRVARYTVSSEKSFAYGYLAAAEAGTMTDPKVEVMIYKMSSSNSTLTGNQYALKDSVKIDGKVYSVSKNSDAIMDLLRSTAAKSGINAAIDGKEPENAEFAQPIRYTTTGNVIDSILTSNSTGEINVSLNLVNYTSEPLLCKATGSTLDKYTISGSQVILVPSDRINGTYMTKSYSYFKKDESYYVQLANVPSTNKPAAIYVYGTATGGADVTTEVLSETNIPMIVTRASDVNYKDQIRRCLKLLSATGEELEVYDDGRDNTEAVRTVSAGDVIRVAADGDKLVDAIEVLAVAEDVVSGKQKNLVTFDGTSNGKDELDAPLRVVTGLVHNAKENTVVMAPSFDYPTDEDVYTYTYTENVNVYVIDTSRAGKDNMIEEGNFSNIIGYNQRAEDPSKVMVYTKKGDVVAMIVFK